MHVSNNVKADVQVVLQNDDIFEQAKLMFVDDPKYKGGWKFDYLWNNIKNLEKFNDTYAKKVSNSCGFGDTNSASDSATQESPEISIRTDTRVVEWYGGFGKVLSTWGSKPTKLWFTGLCSHAARVSNFHCEQPSLLGTGGQTPKESVVALPTSYGVAAKVV
ncbi:hypothetical protein F2Q69_00036889 [Brassica cretica]|uniref:Uncharacterized protein n=1 Tax=Brassica cretica TaxID=69181 RepID=A0A8S9SRU8_BRACR|nr:hypothetical protein F2Q69_00036889 [Brassica cretica]